MDYFVSMFYGKPEIHIATKPIIRYYNVEVEKDRVVIR